MLNKAKNGTFGQNTPWELPGLDYSCRIYTPDLPEQFLGWHYLLKVATLHITSLMLVLQPNNVHRKLLGVDRVYKFYNIPLYIKIYFEGYLLNEVPM